MRPSIDLFFLPIALPFLKKAPGEEIMKLLERNAGKIEGVIVPERSYRFEYEGFPFAPDRESCAHELLMLPEPGGSCSPLETLFRCIEFVSRNMRDHGQICIFASPMLTVLEDRFLRNFQDEALRERNPTATVEPAGKHPCLLLRIEENPKNFPYNHNYRYHKLEIPGLLKMDERGENIVDVKDNKPLYRRQDYPPIFIMNHALTALPFSRLTEYPDLLSEGEVRAQVMERVDAIVCRNELDLFLTARHRSALEIGETIPTAAADGISTVEAHG